MEVNLVEITKELSAFGVSIEILQDFDFMLAADYDKIIADLESADKTHPCKQGMECPFCRIRRAYIRKILKLIESTVMTAAPKLKAYKEHYEKRLKEMDAIIHHENNPNN